MIDKEQHCKKIFEKVFKIIGELDFLEKMDGEFCSCEKSNILFEAKNTLLNGFEEELEVLINEGNDK